MDLADYYSKSFKGFTKNPKLMLPALAGNILTYIVAIIMVIIFIFGVTGTEFLSTGNMDMINTIGSAKFITYFSVFMLVYFVIAIIITSYMNTATIGMSRNIINGGRPGLDVAVKDGNHYFLKILAVSIILILISMVFMGVFILGLIIDRAYGLTPMLTLIGGLASLILLLGTILLFIFAYQSIVTGEESVIGALKDSVKVLRKNFVDVIVVLIINLVIIICIMVVLFFIRIFLGVIPVLGSLLGLILGLIVNSIVFPYFTLVLTYLYMDKKDLISPELEYVD